MPNKKTKPKKNNTKKQSPMKSLNSRQRLFVKEYVKDFDAGKAYLRAGYQTKDIKKAQVCAYKLKDRTNVKAAIEYEMKKREKKAQKEGKDVIHKFLEIAFTANMKDFCEWGIYDHEKLQEAWESSDSAHEFMKKAEGLMGVRLKSSKGMPKEQSYMIQEISEGLHGVKIKLVNKMDALKELAKIFNLYKEPENDDKNNFNFVNIHESQLEDVLKKVLNGKPGKKFE